VSRKRRDQPLCQARRGAAVDQRAQLVEAEGEPDAGRNLEVGRVLLRAAEGAVPDPSVDLIQGRGEPREILPNDGVVGPVDEDLQPDDRSRSLYREPVRDDHPRTLEEGVDRRAVSPERPSEVSE